MIADIVIFVVAVAAIVGALWVAFGKEWDE